MGLRDIRVWERGPGSVASQLLEPGVGLTHILGAPSIRAPGACLALLWLLGCGTDTQVQYVDRYTPVGTDAESMRGILRMWTFGTTDLPGDPVVLSNGAGSPYDNWSGVASSETQAFELDFGLSSTVYTLYPETEAKTLIIYNPGHQGLESGQRVAEFFLGEGYAVSLHAMPLFGPNAQSSLLFFSDGDVFVRAGSHSEMEEIEEKGLRTFQLFTKTIDDLLLYYENQFDHFVLIGLSGGGWTTDLYAAMDSRFTASYSVAGSLPISLRMGPDIGDFEQLAERDIYDLLGFEDFYYLSARGGHHRQIYVRFDNCCFAWNGRESSYYAFAERVQSVLSLDELGGDFQLFLLEGNEHKVNEEALQIIKEDLGSIIP